jgi:hypothetical protein
MTEASSDRAILARSLVGSAGILVCAAWKRIGVSFANRARMAHPRPPSPLVGALLLAIGCTASQQFTKTSSVSAPSKPANCSFDILSARPQRAFDELGIIEFIGGAVNKYTGYREGVPDNASDLKVKTAKAVCSAGGDAVLTDVNGVGQYIRATVIRYKAE